MIIDAHAHVYANPRILHMKGGTTFMSVADQVAVMDNMAIDKAVILPMASPDASVELQGIDEILGICSSYPGRFIPFCNVDPRLKGSYFFKAGTSHFEFILNQYKCLGCRGLGEICSRVYFDDPALLDLFEACQRVGFPVTFHTCIEDSDDYGLIDEIGFVRFEKILHKFPNLVFLAHSQCFWTEISGDFEKKDKLGYPKGPVKAGGAVPRLMRKHRQLYGDLSATSGINALIRDPQHAYDFIDEFQDQLVFGLDYCSPANDRPHIQWFTKARDQGHISPDAYEKIMWKNVASILKLDL